MRKIVVVNVDWDRNFSGSPQSHAVCCVVTSASWRDFQDNMEEALRWHIDGMRHNGDAIPAEFDGEFDIRYELSPMALLHAMPTEVGAILAGCNKKAELLCVE